MRVIGLLPVGLVLAGGLVVGCDKAPGVEDTTADLQMSKFSPFESIVSEEDYVSNLAPPGSKDPQPDADLLNAWGLVFSDQGLAWVAANHTGTDRVYDSEGNLRGVVPLVLSSGDPASPTGQVINPSRKAFNGDDFIVVSEDGVIFGIKVKGVKNGMVDAEAVIEVDNSTPNRTHAQAANYKGVALAFVHGKPRLFATDFRNAAVDVFDENFVQQANPGFVDQNLPNDATRTFANFNILTAGDRLIITYAVQGEGADDDVAGPGNGVVDIFETNGRFVERLLTGPKNHPEINSPWGMALSAEKNERKSVDLLLGNFGDGHINVYELTLQGKRVRADFEGPLGVIKGKKAQPLVISGLWAVVFGNDKGGFDAEDIYFTAGPDNGPGTELEENGLFGELEFVSRRR